MEHFPYCPHRNNKPADDCMWCATERGDDPFGNAPWLGGVFFGNDPDTGEIVEFNPQRKEPKP